MARIVVFLMMTVVVCRQDQRWQALANAKNADQKTPFPPHPSSHPHHRPSSLTLRLTLPLGQQTPWIWRQRLLRVSHGPPVLVAAVAILCGITSSSSRGLMQGRQQMTLSHSSTNGILHPDPVCQSGKWPRASIVGVNLLNLVAYITAWPDTTLDEMAAFMYKERGDLYTCQAISKRLENLDILTRKRASIEG